MCNLYATMEMRAEIARIARVMRDRNNNQPPMPGVYPDYPAPIIIRMPDGSREMVNARWGMPSSKKALLDAATKRADGLRKKEQEFDFTELLRMEPDRGTTNVRNTDSAHWKPHLTAERRCLVPFTSFAEPNQAANASENVWLSGVSRGRA
jgi:putative SOS response-associated peptidase YedK